MTCISRNSSTQTVKKSRRALISMYPISTSLLPELSPSHFTPQTNELLHHYTSTLYKMLSSKRSRSVWRIDMPILGLSHPFVLSGLLSLSALHLSSLIPSRRREFLNYAISQESAALPSFRKAMVNCNPDSIDAVFAFAGNAICYVLASPRDMYGGEKHQQQPDRCRLPSRNDDHAHWFIMMRGLMAFLSNNWSGIAKGSFAPLLHGDPGPVYASYNPDDEQLVKLEQLFESFDSSPTSQEEQQQPLLRPLPAFSSSPPSHTLQQKTTNHDPQIYHTALLELRRVFALPYTPHRTICTQTAAHMWPGSLNQDFVELIYERDERALVILAHYCVLLKKVDHVWYLKGLGKGLLESIWEVLGEEWRPWVRWAREWEVE